MYCGCGIIIAWPRRLYRGQKAKTFDKNDLCSAEVAPRSPNAVKKAASIIHRIVAKKDVDEQRVMRSAAPSPESLEETKQHA